MNLLKKGIVALLIIFAASCEDEYKIINPADEDSTGKGLDEITLSSFTATASLDENGVEDGTYITVKPLSVGATSYTVDFGNGDSPVAIKEQGGSASYDYPNKLEEVKYEIIVTAVSDALDNVVDTMEVTVTHKPIAVTTTPTDPTIALANGFSIYSEGVKFNDTIIVGFRSSAASLKFNNGDAQYAEITTESGKVLQYSRLHSEVASIKFDAITVADTYGTGSAATNFHLDAYSSFAEGIDKLKITLVDNSDENNAIEYVAEKDLKDGEWAGFDIALADGFQTKGTVAQVVKFDEIKLETGTGGSAKGAATLHIDNIYLSKPFGSTILNGDFESGQDHWKITGFSNGTTTNPFNATSDGSWTNYDGSANGSKTKGAKWTSGTSAGAFTSTNTRYAYQALKLTPNTDYILEYQYAIKSDDATNEPEGGRRIVAEILDGHFTDGVDAIESSKEGPLARHSGTVAGGKFSDTIGTTVTLDFTTNDTGEVSVWIYGITPHDAYVDNVKVRLN